MHHTPADRLKEGGTFHFGVTLLAPARTQHVVFLFSDNTMRCVALYQYASGWLGVGGLQAGNFSPFSKDAPEKVSCGENLY